MDKIRNLMMDNSHFVTYTRCQAMTEINSYTRAVAKELPINGNTGKAFSAGPHVGTEELFGGVFYGSVLK
jgi:hypothetical protein